MREGENPVIAAHFLDSAKASLRARLSASFFVPSCPSGLTFRIRASHIPQKMDDFITKANIAKSQNLKIFLLFPNFTIY